MELIDINEPLVPLPKCGALDPITLVRCTLDQHSGVVHKSDEGDGLVFTWTERAEPVVIVA